MYGNNFKKFENAPDFVAKTPAQVRNFWMNHKFKGLRLLLIKERGELARKTRKISINGKSRRIFKGKVI